MKKITCLMTTNKVGGLFFLSCALRTDPEEWEEYLSRHLRTCNLQTSSLLMLCSRRWTLLSSPYWETIMHIKNNRVISCTVYKISNLTCLDSFLFVLFLLHFSFDYRGETRHRDFNNFFFLTEIKIYKKNLMHTRTWMIENKLATLKNWLRGSVAKF